MDTVRFSFQALEPIDASDAERVVDQIRAGFPRDLVERIKEIPHE